MPTSAAVKSKTGVKKKAKKKSSVDPGFRALLLPVVKHFQDIQDARKVAGNRVSAQKDAHLPEEAVAWMKERVGVLVAEEAVIADRLKGLVTGIPIYDEWLKPHVKGVGSQFAAYLLSLINIENRHNVSQLWSWSGIGQAKEAVCTVCGHRTWTTKDRCPAVVGRSKRPRDDEDAKTDEEADAPDFDVEVAPDARVEVVRGKGSKVVKYGEDRSIRVPNGCICRVFGTGDRTRAVVLCNGSLEFSGKVGIQRCPRGELHPFVRELKSILLGRIATGLCMQRGYYFALYLDQRQRLDAAFPELSDGHRDKRARRFMIKTFTADLWRRWRITENLEVRPPYSQEYLKHMPSKVWTGPENAGQDPEGLAGTHASTASAEKAEGHFAELVALLGETHPLVKESHPSAKAARVAAGVAQVAYSAGNPERVAECWEEAKAEQKQMSATVAAAKKAVKEGTLKPVKPA